MSRAMLITTGSRYSATRLERDVSPTVQTSLVLLSGKVQEIRINGREAGGKIQNRLTGRRGLSK